MESIILTSKNQSIYEFSLDLTDWDLFIKPYKSFFGDFEYLEWLESSFQALSIGTTYMVWECI